MVNEICNVITFLSIHFYNFLTRFEISIKFNPS